MSIAEKKAAYEASGMKVLMDASGHTICDRCYCCDAVAESSPCWQCGGFEPEEEDLEWGDFCSVCAGEGDLCYTVCVGKCDEDGNHKPPVT